MQQSQLENTMTTQDTPIHVSLGELKEVLKETPESTLTPFIEPLNNRLNKYKINSKLRVSHFLAQIAHESGGFRYRTENLKYSARALCSVFGKYFDSKEMAENYAYNPKKIACLVYANRLGNGAENTEDGWTYRGRGLIQLTGKFNYRQCGDSLGVDFIKNPDILAEDPDLCVAAACWYWDSHKLNRHADADDIRKITRAINGGLNGIKDREKYLARAKESLR